MSVRFLYDRQKIAVTYKESKFSYKDVIRYVKFYSSLIKAKDGEKIAVLLEEIDLKLFLHYFQYGMLKEYL